MDFLFIFKDEKIAILRCENNEFIPIRYEGEEFFDFKDNFWEWFKEKIEYQNEPVSFIVLNKSSFFIPHDIKLKSKNNLCLEKIDFEYENVLSFPKVNLQQKKVKKLKPLKKEIKTKKTLTDFYKEETKRYQDED